MADPLVTMVEPAEVSDVIGVTSDGDLGTSDYFTYV